MSSSTLVDDVESKTNAHISKSTENEFNDTLVGRARRVTKTLDISVEKNERDDSLTSKVPDQDFDGDTGDVRRGSSVHLFGNSGSQARDDKGMIYIENSFTGCFHCMILEENDISINNPAGVSTTRSTGLRRENNLKFLIRKMKGALLFVQGAISGLSIFHYSHFSGGNEMLDCSQWNRSYELGGQTVFIVFSTLCLTGVLLNIVHYNKESSTLTFSIKIFMAILYFIAMVLSLSITRVSLILKHKIQQGLSQDELEISFQEYYAMGISRSLCCMLACAVTTFNIF